MKALTLRLGQFTLVALCLSVVFRYALNLCIGLGYATYYIGWHCESLKSLTITAISWGIGLFIHFIFFLFEQKKTIKGYARDEIFQ